MTAYYVIISFTVGVDKINKNNNDFKRRVLEVTVYKNVHISSL